MATERSFVDYVCEQISTAGDVSAKKMFGEYMVYLNGIPVFCVCDNTVYVKKYDSLSEYLSNASVGNPYDGAKEHYILDIDNSYLSVNVALSVEAERRKKGK